MNYIALVQRAVADAKVGIPSPTGVSGLTGLAGDIARWTAQAWLDIQNEFPTSLRCLRVRNFTATLTVADNEYSVTSIAPNLALTTFSIFDAKTLFTQKADGTLKRDLDLLPYNVWMERYKLATFVSGQPTAATMSNDDTILFNTLPDIAYQLKGDYWRAPQELTADATIPLLPVRWHMLIVYRALQYLALDREQQTMFQQNKDNEDAMIVQMQPTELEVPSSYLVQPILQAN
jgi:hypothetical protein